MKPRRTPTRRHILSERLVLVLLHAAAIRLMARYRLMEHLLSPGSQSQAAVGATLVVLMLRMLLFGLAPGWMLSRLWLRATRTPGKD
jgi:hypothetical protein